MLYLLVECYLWMKIGRIQIEMNKSIKIEVIEFLLFGIIWIGIFSIPFFNQWGYATLDWKELLSDWLRIFGFFVVFLINILLLIPKYLITKKYKPYIFSAISMIIFVSVAGQFLNSSLLCPLMMPPRTLVQVFLWNLLGHACSPASNPNVLQIITPCRW